jgi:hypothetical protein
MSNDLVSQFKAAGGKLAANTTDFVWRMRAAIWAYGTQMYGLRDLYKVFGWKIDPRHEDFVRKYRKEAMAKRVILAPVNALWSDPPKVVGDDAFQAAWKNLLAQHPIFFHLQRLDKLCGLGKYAVLVVGFDDGSDLERPVQSKPDRKVLYYQPYAEGAVKIDKWVEDPRDPRFGLPLIYNIDPGNFESDRNYAPRTANPLKSFKVHWTRVLHVAEDTLESTVFGASRLESCYNVLDDILKVTGGSAETYWLTANRGLHIDVDKDMDLDDDDKEDLAAEVEEYQNEQRRVLRTRGVKVESLGSEVADPRGVFDVQLSMLASNTGIPKRVLAGSEAGQLASQQDRANWSQRVEERITEYGEPIVLLPFIVMHINAGVLPQPSTMTIEWPDAFKMNPFERAQTSAQMARSAANVAKTLATIDKMNIEWATAAQPQIIPQGGGGFFGNARNRMELLQQMIANAPKPPTEGADPAPAPEPLEMPPIVDARSPIELLTVEEGRAIIGFGKHQPVFDERSDTEKTKATAGPQSK